MSADKPHKRLSLTQPSAPATVTPPDQGTSVAIAAPLPAATEPEIVRAVRVMAYLTPDEADLLDALWLSLRRNPARPSKSDILRAALRLAGASPDELTATLAQQQDGTLIRQRASKQVKTR